MKKLLVVAVIVALVAVGVIVYGISSTGKNEANTQGESSGNQKVEFEEIEGHASLPQDVIDILKLKRGFEYVEADDGLVLFISLGEKNTGGYAVSVKTVEVVDGVTRVVVEETEPKKEDIVIQAITYPYTIVKITGSTGDIQVENQDGGKFSRIKADEDVKPEDDLIKGEGSYVGQIDGHSVEIIVDGEPTAFRHDEELKAYIESLKKDDKVRFTYFKNEHGQLILTSIEKTDADK